ncbi:MAG: methylmalonyl-CoA mutase family protein, partial [Chloroflexota bacterium]|nr:methylmalonyl-CoA mutase family protein [Chloroflexota bacterium]
MTHSEKESTTMSEQEKETAFDKIEKGFWQKASDYATEACLHLKETYTPKDVEGIDYDQDLGDPGTYPFTRGSFPNGYRGRLWTMRQETGFGMPEDTNQRIRQLVSTGATGVNFIPDVPTLLGIDPDHPLAEGEVGAEGVPLYSLKDMEILLAGVPIEKVSTSIAASCVAPILLCQYISAAEKRGLDISGLRVTIQNDPLRDRILSH